MKKKRWKGGAVIGCLAIFILIMFIGLLGNIMEFSPVAAGILFAIVVIFLIWYSTTGSYKRSKQLMEEGDRLKKRYQNGGVGLGRRSGRNVTGDLLKSKDLHDRVKAEERRLGRKLTENEKKTIEYKFTDFLWERGIRYEGFYARQERIKREDAVKQKEADDIFKKM